jgi:hypothetical protein
VNGLTTKQHIILAFYGAFLWFVAAMLVRYVGPMGAFEGNALWITYILVIPGTIPALLIGKRIAGLSKPQMLGGVAIVTATAALLDGIALAWFPTLYGTDPWTVLTGAALILWGVGVGLVLAWIMGRHQPV